MFCKLFIGLFLIAAAPLVAEEKSDGMDAVSGFAIVKPNPVFAARPLTVECRARLNGKTGYNILVACEPKSSSSHWELYTHAKTGELALYVPGNHPPDVRSSMDVTDGRWHSLCAVLDGEEIRLYVDGNQVAREKENRPKDRFGEGLLAIGALAEQSLHCNGRVSNVRLSNIARQIMNMPAAPFENDANTIGLWQLDTRTNDVYADSSRLKNHARFVTHSAASLRQTTTAPTSADIPRSAGQIGVIPPPCDVPATRKLLADALLRLHLPTLGAAVDHRDGLLVDWDEQYWHLDNQVAGRQRLPGPPEQAYDRHALCDAGDGDPLGVILRRSAALLKHLKNAPAPSKFAAEEADLAALKAAAEKIPLSERETRKGFFLAACILQRRIALANPLLDFDDILFVARGVYNGSRKGGLHGTSDVQGQHFQTQYFGFNAIPGGGLFAVKNFKTAPRIVNLLENAVVRSGRLAGKQLQPGAFLSPDLSYDGRSIVFSYTQNKAHNWAWTPETSWKIFRMSLDASDLTQLTDGPWDDFDACWLPNGRIAFISERRGGYIRCFKGLEVPQHTLHSMKADGNDIYPLSYFETGEWQPSVNNEGMIVYTRWDYVDREDCEGSNFWICHSDGRDPRAPHGNYPQPWHTFPDNTLGDGRRGRPMTEMNIRAVPDSHRYIFTAAPHHGETFGSLCMLDMTGRDDYFMSQIKRITPYVPFPESEMGARLQYQYGTAWPLSNDYYLCNAWENIYLLDRFGNQVLLCENSMVFGGQINWDMRLIDPIPLKARKCPPQLPTLTNKGQDARPIAPRATLRLVNVYDADQPLPPNMKIKFLRVVQDVPKDNPMMDSPMIGYAEENTPRIPLGIVPVEEDGSAYFEAPVERELIFQALDANFMAVQSMRSVAYVQPGEQLTCQGCHEDTHKPPAPLGTPLAFRRQPSPLQPEVGPVEPVSYYRTVLPTFQKTCLPCHTKERKGPQDMSHAKLEPYAFYFSGGFSGQWKRPIHGGTRSIPGRIGARNSLMGQILSAPAHRARITPEEYHRIILWLDCNSPRLGAYHEESRQMAGELIWPRLDVDVNNLQGLERPAKDAALPIVAPAANVTGTKQVETKLKASP